MIQARHDDADSSKFKFGLDRSDTATHPATPQYPGTRAPLFPCHISVFLRYRYHLHRTPHRDHTVVCNSTPRRIASRHVTSSSRR
jgi:hypothetical protein